MKNTTKFLSAGAVVLAMGLSAAPATFAKGHNQGLTDDPGSMVGSETVVNSQAEGSIQGNGKVAQGNLGKSGSAGRPDHAIDKNN